MADSAALPAVSVVIPVLNAIEHIDECIASVCAQEFDNFEIVLFDDGSNDGTSDRLDEWAQRDARIRVVHGAQRSGAAASSNRAAELARAPLVARMDADDIMLPGRLAAQAALFAEKPGAVLVGGLTWTLDGGGRRVREPDYARLLRRSPFAPFAHSTVMFRRAAWAQIGGYRAKAEKWEDVDFFLRMSAVGEVWTLAMPLGDYRQNPVTSRLADGLDQLEQAMAAMVHAVAPARRSHGRRLPPAVFRHIGSTLLWSGQRPVMLGRILRKADLGAGRESAALLGWAALAQVAPGALRQMLRWRLARANRKAVQVIGGRRALLWTPEVPAGFSPPE